jgi:Ser/Thr protein kinase RdoA (MazF antagonist)
VIDSELRTIAEEFALGTIHNAAPLAGGSEHVTRLDTERGSFVVKRPWNVRDVELYATVARHLNAHGIRQARQLTTHTGEYIASTGHCVQELLPGRIVERPTHRQTLNVMRHLATYDRALAELEVPDWLHDRDTIWTRVTRIDYLLDELPALLEAHDLDAGRSTICSAR